MQLHIKSLKDRRTFTIEISPSADAAQLKAVIEQKQGVREVTQRLVFGGRPLKDGVPLSELGIQKGVGAPPSNADLHARSVCPPPCSR